MDPGSPDVSATEPWPGQRVQGEGWQRLDCNVVSRSELSLTGSAQALKGQQSSLRTAWKRDGTMGVHLGWGLGQFSLRLN